MFPIKNRVFVFLFFALCAGHLPTADAIDRNGPYLGLDLGLAFQEGIKLDGRDTDVLTRCDQLLRAVQSDDRVFDLIGNADEFGLPRITGANANCGRGDSWQSDPIAMGTGLSVGGQLGYMLGNFRAEAEYLYRVHTSGSQERIHGLQGGKDAEIFRAFQTIGTLSSHSLFANIYYDFLNDSRITPYLGAGVGQSRISMLYDAVFTRNSDRGRLPATTPPVSAGTTTDAHRTLRDSALGWQAIVGSDYALEGNWSIGLKVRYAQFSEFADGGYKWDQLRSHDSAIAADEYPTTGGTNPNPNASNALTTQDIRTATNNPNFDPTVRYTIETGRLPVWSAALSLKYTFGGESP